MIEDPSEKKKDTGFRRIQDELLQSTNGFIQNEKMSNDAQDSNQNHNSNFKFGFKTNNIEKTNLNSNNGNVRPINQTPNTNNFGQMNQNIKNSGHMNSNFNINNSNMNNVVGANKNSNIDNYSPIDQEINNFEPINHKNNKDNFMLKYMGFAITLVFITILAIFFTLNSIEKNEKLSKNAESFKESKLDNSSNKKQKKSEASDAKYGIQSYSETYTSNDLEIMRYYDIDGKVMNYEEYSKLQTSSADSRIEYLQIEGLKSESIEEKINDRLKKEAYDLHDSGMAIVSTTETANFSNILSLYICGSNPNEKTDKITTINIDLTTGENIPLESVFVSSAPINAYLSEGLNRALAKAIAYSQPGEAGVNYNMDNADTSEFEDYSLKLVNNYKKNKENVKYTISPSKVTIYNLLDGIDLVKEKVGSFGIDFINHIEEVAIYKRYKTDSSIFEKNTNNSKTSIVLTEPRQIDNPYINTKYVRINYGKLAENIFWEDLLIYTNQNSVPEMLKYSLMKLSSDQSSKLKEETSNKTGVFFQRSFDLYEGNEFYSVGVYEVETTCDIKYFKSLAFKDYIDCMNGPAGELGGTGFFNEYMKDMYPNLTITQNGKVDKNGEKSNYHLYFSKKGEYLGDNESDARKKLKEIEEGKTENGEEQEESDENNQNNSQTEFMPGTEDENAIDENLVDTNTITIDTNTTSTTNTIDTTTNTTNTTSTTNIIDTTNTTNTTSTTNTIDTTNTTSVTNTIDTTTTTSITNTIDTTNTTNSTIESNTITDINNTNTSNDSTTSSSNTTETSTTNTGKTTSNDTPKEDFISNNTVTETVTTNNGTNQDENSTDTNTNANSDATKPSSQTLVNSTVPDKENDDKASATESDDDSGTLSVIKKINVQ